MVLHAISRWFGSGRKEALPAGMLAPTFTLKDGTGTAYSLKESLQQGPVLLAFFKVTCPTCQFTFPFLERLYQAVRENKNLQVWGISQNNAEATREFARDYGCTFPMLLDNEGYPVSNLYGLTTVPTLFLIQPSGKIQLASIGFVRDEVEAVAVEYSKLAGRPIAVFRPGEQVPDSKPG